MINVVLYEPEIPQNAGNIARLCACTGAKLFFVGRLGFSLSDKYLKRSGMDYWDMVEFKHYNTYEELLEQNKGSYYYFTTKAEKLYTEVKFCENNSRDVFLVYGPESRGLPPELLNLNRELCVKIPMREDTRSLNLSNSVAVGVYEVIRQENLSLGVS